MTVLDANATQPIEGGPSFSLANRLQRAAWGVTWALFAAWTPPPFHAWRGFVLRLFGARVAGTARVYGSARIWFPPNLTIEEHACLGPRVSCYNQAMVVIGARATVSQGAYLCAGSHDISDPNFQLVVKPIQIGSFAWVAADAFVGPGVTMGEGAVLGARAVAFRDLDPWTVYVGNPACEIKKRIMR